MFDIGPKTQVDETTQRDHLKTLMTRVCVRVLCRGVSCKLKTKFAHFLFGKSRIDDKHHTINCQRGLSNVC